MKTPEKNLLLSLVADDLMNYRLVQRLLALGLDAKRYSLHLSDSLFYLADLNDEDQEAKRDRYFELSKQVLKLEIEDQRGFELLCESIWQEVFAA